MPALTRLRQGIRALTAWGRPVDILIMPDGSLLVSDDRAGAAADRIKAAYDQALRDAVKMRA